jgi:hypothetical protein
MTSARSEPGAPSRTDTRFATIDDAVALLNLLPPVERIAWPTEPGDEQTVAEALDWLAEWTPRARAAFKRHRRDARAARRNGRVH